MTSHATGPAPTRRRVYVLAGSSVLAIVMVVTVLALRLPSAQPGDLTRAPYLTDLTGSSVRVNLGTSSRIRAVRVRYGPSTTHACTLRSVVVAPEGFPYLVNYGKGTAATTVLGSQWSVQLTGLTSGAYCYVVEGGTDAQHPSYLALPDRRKPPQTFRVGDADTFAVVGDWGLTGTTPPSFANPEQADVLRSLAGSGADFAVSTGDIGYPNGSQSNYGDLLHTGQDVSAVFGPNYWPVPGAHIPLFPVPGNHGFNSVFTALWPAETVAAESGGRASDGSYVVNRVKASTPDYWYAFNAQDWRIYILTASWPDRLTTDGSQYAEDYRRHWAPGSSERTWLSSDLERNAAARKIVVFHYPLYSAANTGEVGDRYLTAPPDHTESLETLLATHNVKLVLNGHAHLYERNNPHHGLVSIISGGGGGSLAPVQSGKAPGCAQTYRDTGLPIVAVARGWGLRGGTACHASRPPATANVYSYLRIRLTPTTAVVEAIDSTGSTFDQTTIS